MQRRDAVCALIALGASPFALKAQPAAKIPRVGILVAGSLKPAIPRPIGALLQALREIGYIDGQTIFIEFRAAEGKPERLADLAADLVRANADAIVASGDDAIRAASRATNTIPIVMATSGDAVSAGFVASLSRPGGNITGMTAIAPDLSAKRLQMVKEFLPRSARVAVLWSPTDPVHAFDWTHMQAAEKTVGVKLQSVEIQGAEGFDRAFAQIGRAPADALMVLHNSMIREQRGRILEFTAKSKLPAMYEAAEYVDEGGLIAYGVTHSDLFRRSASHLDRILKGAKPAELPVEQPTRLELAINLKTARTLGIKIPRPLLIRADRVIE